jgi:nucleoside-diphosphate-sugar epimerase
VRPGARVLIVGCGDLGSRLALRLYAAGAEIWGLRRNVAALPSGIHPFPADLQNEASLAGLPPQWDATVFCATPAARSPEGYRATFTDGTRRVLGRLDDPGRVLFVSSTAVYGQDAGEWVDEDSPTEPAAFNGRCLLEAEQALRERLPEAIVARPSGLYGPGRTRMLRLARDALALPPPRWTNRIHIEDAAAALAHLLGLQRPRPLYLLNDDEPSLEPAVIAWLRRELGLPLLPPPPDAPALGKRVGNARLRTSGFRPAYPDFRSGYRELLRELR